MKTIAILHSLGEGKRRPFSEGKMNKAYADFLERGRVCDVKFVLSDYRWYSKGFVSKCWVFESGWKLNGKTGVDLIYDKFHTDSKTIRLKKSMEKKPGLVNRVGLEILAKDKLKTYRTFPDIVPRCFLVNNQKEYKKALSKIKADKVVIKPLMGEGGEGICIVNKNKNIRIPKNTLVQEFIDSSNGIKGLVKGVHDIRVIVINGRIVQCYIRKPRKGLISNIALGGRMIFVPNSRIPRKVLGMKRVIERKLSIFHPRIYTADFLFDGNQRPWLIELNTKPGIYPYGGHPKYEHILFDHIIKALRKT